MRRHFALLSLCALLLSMSMVRVAEGTNVLEKLKIAYDFTHWGGQTVTNYASSVTNWVPDFSSIGVTSLVSEAAYPAPAGSRESGYTFLATDNTNVTIELTVAEGPSVLSVHEAMMTVFARSTVIPPYPRGDTNGVAVGDRCYIGSTSATSDVWFCRNNVLVHVSTAASNYSVGAIADGLDAELLTISTGE